VRAQTSVATLGRGVIQLSRGPLHKRHKPSARPQGSASVIRRQDNLRVGNGDFSPGGRYARHGWQVSWLAGRGTGCQRAFLAFPELFRDTKRRTIRRKRGVQPRLFVSPLQWLFPPASTSGRPHHAIRRHQSPQGRMEGPRCNTVAGSAAFGLPCMGPGLRIPFCSPASLSAVRKPSATRIRPGHPASQSRLRCRAVDKRRPSCEGSIMALG
jgi:hypothetical protein